MQNQQSNDESAQGWVNLIQLLITQIFTNSFLCQASAILRFFKKIVIKSKQYFKNLKITITSKKKSQQQFKLAMFNFTLDLNHLPQHCRNCSYLFYKWGACPFPDTSVVWAWMSLIPYGIIIFLLLRMIVTRKVSHINLFLLLVTAYLVGDRIIKKLLKSHRPEQACAHSYGLPSSHMTVMVGFSFFAISYYKDLKLKVVLVILCILQGFARIQLRYHTLEQVLVGTVFGILYSSLYVKVTNWLYFRMKKYISKLTKIRFIGLVDDYHTPNKIE